MVRAMGGMGGASVCEAIGGMGGAAATQQRSSYAEFLLFLRIHV